jgi:hypothetical protein
MPATDTAGLILNKSKGSLMKRASIIAVAAAAIATGPAWMSAAAAQGYGAQPQQEQQQQMPSFSDAELQTFAEAAKEVQQINQEYQPQMQQAQTPEEQQSIRDEATEKMVEAIEQKGLSVEQYNQIASAAQSDPETAEKINSYLR